MRVEWRIVCERSRAVVVDQVVVVGGGVIGMLCALELTDRKVPVRLLESPASHAPASWAGGGILSPLFPWRFSEGLSALCQHALRDYQALARQILDVGGEDPEVSPHPLLCLGDDPAERVEGWARRWQRQVRHCDAGERYPHLAGQAAWRLEDSGSIRNPRLLKGLRTLLAARGVQAESVQVRAVSRLSSLTLETDKGALSASRVVIAAGYGSATLLEGLGVQHDMQPVKGQMLRYTGASAVPDEVILAAEGYLIPRRDGSVLAGSTLEPGSDDTQVDTSARVHLQRMAQRLWPPLQDLSPENHWAGVRPGRRRDVPVIDSVAGDERVWVCSGHFRNGLVSAPASARLLVQAMLGEHPDFDLTPYSFSSPGSSDSF